MSLPNVWQLSTKTGLPCNTGATMQCDSVANPAYDPTSHMSTSIERIANLEIELAQERDHMAQERARAQEREDRIIARVVELERGQRGARS